MKHDFLNMTEEEIEALPNALSRALVENLLKQDATAIMEFANARGWQLQRTALAALFLSSAVAEVAEVKVVLELREWYAAFFKSIPEIGLEPEADEAPAKEEKN